jgi:EAL domain-containing protein (putative c-di-GMP-specific phosphodiesterase class I)
MPNAVYSPVACIQLTLESARKHGLPTSRLNFEFTENEELDADHVAGIIAAYRQMGFTTALDDFGAGHAGLGLLARFTPDSIKLDRGLIQDIDTSLSRRMIVESVVRLATSLGLGIVAEGIERQEEALTLSELGVRYMQGYWFARPEIGKLPVRNSGAALRRAA